MGTINTTHRPHPHHHYHHHLLQTGHIVVPTGTYFLTEELLLDTLAGRHRTANNNADESGSTRRAQDGTGNQAHLILIVSKDD